MSDDTITLDSTVDGLQVIEPLQGPYLSADVLRDRAARQQAAEADRDRQDTQDWLAGLRAKAEAESQAWLTFPCKGVLESVGMCSDAFEDTCQRRDHIMCPRRRMVEVIAERRHHRGLLRSRLSAAGVPERTLTHVFDAQPLETEALKALQAALESKPTIVVLSGGVGCGKSCAAAWWLSQAEGAWVAAADLAKVGDDAVTAQLRAKRLVLDDLGMEYLDGKGYLLAKLDSLVEHRNANMMPTVITTNLGAAEFKSRYGKRVEDRIREAGPFVVIAAPSLRRRS